MSLDQGDHHFVVESNLFHYYLIYISKNAPPFRYKRNSYILLCSHLFADPDSLVILLVMALLTARLPKSLLHEIQSVAHFIVPVQSIVKDFGTCSGEAPFEGELHKLHKMTRHFGGSHICQVTDR